MDKELGVGVVGMGMGRNVLHLNGLGNTRLSVRGLCDTDEQLLEKRAEEFGVRYTTTDYDQLLEREDIDIIGIYTPDSLHCEQTLKALEAGKHVVVTKPMVNTLEEAEEVVAAVRKTGLMLLVGETIRFNLTNMAIRDMVESGKIGRPIFVQAHYVHDMRPVIARTSWRDDPTNKRFLVGSACHAIDHVLWHGGDVKEVSAYANDGGILKGREGYNNFVVNLEFQNGVIGRVLGLYGVVHPPLPMEDFGICGTKGAITKTKYTLDTPDGVETHDLEVPPDEYAGHGGQVVRYMLHLEDCILNGKQPLVDAVQGAKTTAVSYAALESIETRRSVKVRTDF